MDRAANLFKPEHLAQKLVQIRKALGLSQNGMIRRIGLTEVLIREEISAFERGLRVPPVIVLLFYARVAGISVDVLIDDELDLPKRLPVDKSPGRIIPPHNSAPKAGENF